MVGEGDVSIEPDRAGRRGERATWRRPERAAIEPGNRDLAESTW